VCDRPPPSSQTDGGRRRNRRLAQPGGLPDSVRQMRTRARRWFGAAVLVSALLIGTLAAPAGAAGADPSAWAGSVCSALDSWTSTIGTASAKVAKVKPKSTSDVKERLAAFLGTAQTETAALLKSLKQAGAPDVKGGKQLAASLREGYAQALRVLGHEKLALKKVSTKNPTAFLNAVRGVQDNVESGLEGVQAAFSAVRTADVAPLLDAFKSEKECRSVAS
jgi:hypothetical protein